MSDCHRRAAQPNLSIVTEVRDPRNLAMGNAAPYKKIAAGQARPAAWNSALLTAVAARS
jgi:hypothetical protein